MVSFSPSDYHEYVVKVEFMSARKCEVHRFCLFTDAVKCLKQFQSSRDVYYISLHTELVHPREYNPLFDC